MYGIGPDYSSGIILALMAIAWHRAFWREGKCSLYSLLVAMTGIAIWLIVFRPWQPSFF